MTFQILYSIRHGYYIKFYSWYYYVVKIKNIFRLYNFNLTISLHCYQFRQEQMLRHMLRKEEKKLVTIHRLAEKSYIGLLDLSTHAEIAVTWDDDDLREYSRKRPWGL